MKQPKPWRRRAVPAKSPSDPTPTTTDNRRPTAKQDKKRPVSPSRQTPLTGPHPPRTARFARATEHGHLHCSKKIEPRRHGEHGDGCEAQCRLSKLLLSELRASVVIFELCPTPDT